MCKGYSKCLRGLIPMSVMNVKSESQYHSSMLISMIVGSLCLMRFAFLFLSRKIAMNCCDMISLILVLGLAVYPSPKRPKKKASKSNET